MLQKGLDMVCTPVWIRTLIELPQRSELKQSPVNEACSNWVQTIGLYITGITSTKVMVFKAWASKKKPDSVSKKRRMPFCLGVDRSPQV